jgi:hypothetical protein
MERLRTVRFSPHRKGMGPTFTLTTYDAGTKYEDGITRNYLGYALTMREPNGIKTLLFKGKDIGLPPGTAIDSNESIRAVMGWLTLKPGDTDSDFFAKYTKSQLEFCAEHAEALSCEVANRFGED